MNRQEHLLTILGEECSELHQETSKALRFGVDEQRDLPTTNRERMQKEFNDMLAMVEMLKAEEIYLFKDEQMIYNKVEKVERYLSYSEELGTLKENKL